MPNAHSGALHKIMRSWGSLLTWTAQREHASQIVRGMKSFFDSTAFVMNWGKFWGMEGLVDGEGWWVARVALSWALIHIGDPNRYYILIMALYVSSL